MVPSFVMVTSKGVRIHRCIVIVRVATLREKQNSLTFHWLFPDQIQFFTDQITAVLWPICLLAADKWQISFTSSLKCNSHWSVERVVTRIKSLNSFLAQNVLKLASFHSFERAKQAREKINTFHVVKIPATTHFGPKLWNSLTFPWLSWYLKFPWPICKFPDFSLTLKKKQISLIFPWPVATLIVLSW